MSQSRDKQYRAIRESSVDKPKQSGPQRIGDVVSALLARRGYAQLQSINQCQTAWQEAVGPQLAGQTQAGNLRRGVLEIFVRNSTVLHELSFQKKQLLKKLAENTNEHKINDLRFRVGEID